jgi:hypothetical protein
MQLAEKRAVIIESNRQRVAELSLRGAVKAISPPRPAGSNGDPSSPKSQTNGLSPKKRPTHCDLLGLWLVLPVAERKLFFDAIGLRPILESIPESWRPLLPCSPER